MSQLREPASLSRALTSALDVLGNLTWQDASWLGLTLLFLSITALAAWATIGEARDTQIQARRRMALRTLRTIHRTRTL